MSQDVERDEGKGEAFSFELRHTDKDSEHPITVYMNDEGVLYPDEANLNSIKQRISRKHNFEGGYLCFLTKTRGLYFGKSNSDPATKNLANLNEDTRDMKALATLIPLVPFMTRFKNVDYYLDFLYKQAKSLTDRWNTKNLKEAPMLRRPVHDRILLACDSQTSKDRAGERIDFAKTYLELHTLNYTEKAKQARAAKIKPSDLTVR